MADAVTNVIRTAVQIRRMCERAKACRALVDVVERKMASLIPVMAEIQDHLEEMDTTAVTHLTTALARDMRECRTIVQRASQMSKISYIVHSNDLREQIERNLRAIHLALMSLQASQNTYLIHQNQRLADEFRKFHLAWQQREKELRREEERESRLKARVAKSLEECNQRGANDQDRRQSVAKAAGIRVSQAKWLEKELARARADHDRLVAKMKRDKDTVARSKAKADAMLMDQIITALAISESINTNLSPERPTPPASALHPPEANHTSTGRNLPEDCFCPITNQVMEDPIIVDAPCHHTLSRQAAQQWYGMGKSTCPVCGIEVVSHHLSPNVQVRNITESLLSDGVYKFTENDRPRHDNNDVVVTIDSNMAKAPTYLCSSEPAISLKQKSGAHKTSGYEKHLSRKRMLQLITVVTIFVAAVIGLALGLKSNPVPPEDPEDDISSLGFEERDAQTSVLTVGGTHEVEMACGGVGDRAMQCGASDWASLKFCCDGLFCNNSTNTCTDEVDEIRIDEEGGDHFSFDMQVICVEDYDTGSYEVCGKKRLEDDRNFVSLPAGVYDKNNCPGEADLFDTGDEIRYTWTFYEMVDDPFNLAIDIYGCENSTKRVLMRMYTYDISRTAPEFDCIDSTYSTCGEEPGRGDPVGLGDLTAKFHLTGSNQYLFLGTTGTPLPPSYDRR